MKARHFDFYADEWLAGTAELDNAERGLYITACALIYSHGGSIARDHLRAVCRDHGLAFNRQLRRLIDLGKLIENGARITNKRCENELRNAGERIEKARQNGAKGGRPKGLAKPAGYSGEKLTTNYQPTTTREEERDAIASPKTEGQQRGKSGRGSRLAVDWRPDGEDCQFAEQLGLDPGSTGDGFADYWHAVAGAKGVKLDWSATWRNWCRREVERSALAAGRHRPGGDRPGHSTIVAAVSRIRLKPGGAGFH